jgi:hypothetical protein
MPDFILDMVRSGGLTQQLVAAGYLDPEAV